VSRYGDDIWDFYPYIVQENLKSGHKVINWSISLPNGRKLTDPEYAELLESTKDLIWSLFSDPVEGGKRPKMVTLISKVNYIQPLLRWMVSLGLTRFAQLKEKTLNYVPVARRGKNERQNVADMTVHYRLMLVEFLFLQRDKLNDALGVHPWPHETALSLSGVKRGGEHRKPTTEVIPDAVAGPLAKAALDYVQNRSTKILDAISKTDAAAEEQKGSCSQAQVDARTNSARQAGYAGMQELKAENFRLRTACYIVIDMFSGIRDSEMMSLAENSIAPDRSKDDTMDIHWLHGTIYKTGMRPKKWLVPPVVAEAVEVLTRLTAPMRKKLRQEEPELEELIALPRTGLDAGESLKRLMKRLYTVRNQKHKLFLSVATKYGNSISVLSGTMLNISLKRFCADLGIRGHNGLPYPLHAHQFRRTYARLVARAELGDLLTLRDHFGHWSIDMTTYYADGGADEYETDTELLEMVTNEKVNRQNEIMGSYLNSDTPLANGAHWMKEWRASVRTAANKEELIKEYAGTITLNGTGHSWCVGNARGTGCGGLCVFEAQMCVDCNYGIIGQEHRPVWEGIRKQQNEALALDDMGPGGRVRAQEILWHAEEVLKRLEGQGVT
jgi:integrase